VADGTHHVVSPKLYLGVFLTLVVLTVSTYYAAQIDLNALFPGLNVIVALVIATCKAVLVILFFMHAYYSANRTKLIIVCGFFWLCIMLFMTLGDYASRPWDR
jgi:cytochrome c oxidase subunit IV